MQTVYFYRQGQYMTIHITPEPEFSYVSFESNIPMTSYLPIIEKVLKIFQPGKFILTIFANRVITSILAQNHSLVAFIGFTNVHGPHHAIFQPQQDDTYARFKSTYVLWVITSLNLVAMIIEDTSPQHTSFQYTFIQTEQEET